MQDLMDTLNALKLGQFAQHLEGVLDEQACARTAIAKALHTLAQAELAHRQERSVAYRIEQARFVRIQTIDTFDFDYNASTQKLRSRYLRLLEADLPALGLNALFVGTAGLGKTHLARALGYRLCQNNRRVLFATTHNLVLNLTTAETTGRLPSVLDAYIQPALLILDELGYVSLRDVESNLLFQVISARYDKRRPVVVTTNRPFGEWNQIFLNDAVAHAVLDRLTEKSEVFLVEGQSYRETHQQGLK
jgi:DNA replication protein DnaC